MTSAAPASSKTDDAVLPPPFDDGTELALQSPDGEEKYLSRVLEIRAQVEARSRRPLKVNPEVVAEAEIIGQRFSADLIRLAVRRARTHPNDRVLLMEDLAWARKLLVNGAGSGVAVLICTTLGGLVMGVGAPMLLGPIITETTDKMTAATLGWGGGGIALGAVLLTAGFVMAIRRG
ncbi:hypothetical protein [Microbacterium sp. CGR1]|uniref:hypothetical protein n=1 Tax=Microbacterium sp. CGR1 TaxID=1696072 RepID=UPI003DA6369F